MPRISNDQHLSAKFDFFRREFNDIQTAMRDERLQCLKDRRFYSIAGAMWEGQLGEQFENKPKFEINKVHLAVIRIINEYRNNRIDAFFIPKDGTKDDELCDSVTGLYRADQKDSNAEESCNNAFEEAVGGGIGAWRLSHEYEDIDEDEDEENEDRHQRIKWLPITDADSCVFFNLDAKKQDKSDAKRGYLLTAMTPDAYKEEYNDDPASWPKLISQSEFDWFTPDAVYVAEVYEIEKKKESVFVYRGLAGDEQRFSKEELEADEGAKKDILAATGFKLSRITWKKVRKVHKYIMSGGGILEDCKYIAGKYIPIIVTYGKRWFIDNVERCMGHVRLSADVVRLKNMQMSKLAEISAYSSVEKPIFTVEQMAGHQVAWSRDNIDNPAYQLVNSVKDNEGNIVQNGPLGYTKVPQIPPAMAAILEVTNEDLKDLLGNQEAGEELQNSVSGVAVELVQNKLDMQTFIYISNMAIAKKHEAKVWLSMAKELFVEQGRSMKAIDKSGEISNIELMKPSIDKNGAEIFENDLSRANFEPDIEIGPTSASKRAAVARSMVGLMQVTQNPQDLEVLTATALMNIEGEGLVDVRAYYRKKLIKLGVVKPTDEEMAELQQELANTPPDPNAEFLKASSIKALADAEKTKADTSLSEAKVGQTRAMTIKAVADANKTESETTQGTITHALETIQTLENPAGSENNTAA